MSIKLPKRSHPDYRKLYYAKRCAEDPEFRDKANAYSTKFNHSKRGTAYNLDYYQQTKEYKKVTDIERFVKYPHTYFFSRYRCRARKKGLEFTLTKEDFAKLLEPMVCSVTGVKLIFALDKGPCTPTIDRIDNSKGYIPGNVRLVSWIYNRAKSSSTDEEVLTYLVGPLLEKL